MSSSHRDTDAAAAKVAHGVTDALHTLATEPSLGLYYVMDHAQRAIPCIVDHKQQLRQCGGQLRGADLDAGYALDTFEVGLSDSTMRTFGNIAAIAADVNARRAAALGRPPGR